ncbi:phage tail tube protein [Candidatus Bandiella euplotis]|uniref:Lambda phage family tail protein n=1 Tax=Candidatus Bandiella euplotis TaxID=1664265 RepID=A0ABZ0UJ12_9RICK|nr:phage tail tube protein [Candidatus Bandiella woodruffii]WPX96086.1 Putative lambda phage family tail protein [Candidatus Bandiella woodruffii]
MIKKTEHLKTGKNIAFSILTRPHTNSPSEVKQLVGLKLVKLVVLNKYQDCSTLLDDAVVLREIGNKKVLKISLTGLYTDIEAAQILRDASFSGVYLECQMALEKNFNICGKFMISDFEIECNTTDFMYFTFTLINTGKLHLKNNM